MNKYLEKVAEFNEDDFNYAVGKHMGAKKYLTGGYGINSRLKERGYNSDMLKMLHTLERSQGSFKDKLSNAGKRLILPAVAGGLLGRAGGKLVGKLNKTSGPAASVVNRLYADGGTAAGAYAGFLGGVVADSRDNFNRRIPSQLKKEMTSGHYSKSK